MRAVRVVCVIPVGRRFVLGPEGRTCLCMHWKEPFPRSSMKDTKGWMAARWSEEGLGLLKVMGS